MNFYEKYQSEFARYDALPQDFINDEAIWKLLQQAENPTPLAVRQVLQKATTRTRLEPHEMAILLQNQDPETLEEMYQLAKDLKREIYGERLVFFAPLYLSNKCANNCAYCGFRAENQPIKRKTLTPAEIEAEVKMMTAEGQKRTVLVYGESPETGIDFICESIQQVYQVKSKHGEIRRANINCAPLSVAELKRLKEVGIGTYQVFQETYHHQTYREVHPAQTIKGHYRWRLYAHDRALTAGVDDVGIGVLFGLYDWRFEALGLLYHTIHLEENFNGVGPHTISFPRIEPALGTPAATNPKYAVSDADFKKLIAILRLTVPYTGLILTAREKPALRRAIIPYGVTQIDAGTRIGVGGYQTSVGNALPEKEQFQLGDTRSLDDVIRETCAENIPSLCTACYRAGRTGEHFMELAKTSFVHNFCMPNAICSLKEYLLDYATPETRALGEAVIQKHFAALPEGQSKEFVREALKKLEAGERDLYL